MRGAVESGHRALGATVGAVFGGAIHLAKPYLLSTKLISTSPLAPRAFRRTRENFMFLHRGLAANVGTDGALLGYFLLLLRPS